MGGLSMGAVISRRRPVSVWYLIWPFVKSQHQITLATPIGKIFLMLLVLTSHNAWGIGQNSIQGNSRVGTIRLHSVLGRYTGDIETTIRQTATHVHLNTDAKYWSDLSDTTYPNFSEN